MDIMGKKLEQVFHQANATKAAQITLRVDLIYGSDVLHVSGYRIGDGTWIRFAERNERIPFTHEMITLMMDRLGWCMPARPVRKEGVSFNWFLEPVAAETHHYSTHARDVTAVERHAQNRLFEMRHDWIGA